VIPLLLALLYVEFTQPAYKPTAPISAKPFRRLVGYPLETSADGDDTLETLSPCA
jgi:hypothetical protein